MKNPDIDMLANFRDGLRRSPRLRYLFLELTDRCNLACAHCGSSCSPDKSTFLPFDAVESLLRQVSIQFEPSETMICLTGGEPLLYPDFFRLAELISSLGFPWGITSNGTLIDDGTAVRLLSAGLGSISISIDGPEACHDRLRGRKGAFARALRGTKALTALHPDIPVQVTTVVTSETLPLLDEMFGIVKDSGASSWRIINIDPIGRALEHPDLLLSGQQYRYLFEYIRDKRDDPAVGIEVAYGCSHYLTEEFESEVRDWYFICGAGLFVAGVLANGDIVSCLDIERRPELVQGNILYDDFAQIWRNGFSQYRRDRSLSCETCLSCSERRCCEGDSMHTWDFDKNKPRICMKELLSGTGG